MNGKLTDVLIEEERDEDQRTGVILPCRHLTVWADPGMLEIIRNVPGVSSAYQSGGEREPYSVFLDPRYDLEWVKAEIEARIKIDGEGVA